MTHGDPLPPEFADRLTARCGGLFPLGERLFYYRSIDSTNNVALEAAAAGLTGAIVIADAQTAGRGRYGRTWFSPVGSGLYVSIVMAMSAARVDAGWATSLLTLGAGVALAEAIEAVAALPVTIKWPNDLLVSGRKVAGILAERAAEGGVPREASHVVLGYGINVAPSAFPADLRARATSIETEAGRPVDRAVLCAESLAAIARRHQDLLAGRFDAILDAWRARAPRHENAPVAWQAPQGVQRGVTTGIDESGALLVRVEDRIERLVGGEITWL